MKYIITEEQFQKLNRSSQVITNAIEKYLDDYISEGNRKVTPKPRNYGNLREDWCVDGRETIIAIYYFEKGVFDKGTMLVSPTLVEGLSKFLSIRRTYVLHTILEWYNETMVPKFEQVVGESGLSIDDIDTMTREDECIPEAVKPEGITDEEMIDYVVKNTLYTKNDVLKKLESGEEELNDLYLQIVDIQNRKKITGF